MCDVYWGRSRDRRGIGKSVIGQRIVCGVIMNFALEPLDFLLCLGILRLKYQSTQNKTKAWNIGEQMASSGGMTFDPLKAWLHSLAL